MKTNGRVDGLTIFFARAIMTQVGALDGGMTKSAHTTCNLSVQSALGLLADPLQAALS